MRDAVAEMLRCVSPARYNRRTATADTELHGNRISKGDAVAINHTVANADPHKFPDPFRFDIRRKPSETLAFSVGPHVCLGHAVARLQARIAFEELLGRYPNIELTGDAQYKPTLVTVLIERLPVTCRR